ncbi:MAG: hypothetical protein AAGA45_04465 [Verrucomicrobiota bacterium]
MITTGAHQIFASNLIERSPFLPPGYGEKPAHEVAPKPSPVRKAKHVVSLGGLASVNGQVMACLSAKGVDHSSWYALGDEFLGMRVVHIDLDKHQVKLSDGTAFTIVDLITANPQLPVVTSIKVKKERTVHKSFSSLSPESQQYYRNNPQMIGELYRQSVNVPQELIEQYKQSRGIGRSGSDDSVAGVRPSQISEANGVSSQLDAARSKSVERKRFPLPSTTVSHTAEEKANLAAFARGEIDYLP